MSDAVRALLNEQQLKKLEQNERAQARNMFLVLNACPVHVRDLPALQAVIAKELSK